MPDIRRLTLALALIGCGPSGVSSGSTSDSSTGETGGSDPGDGDGDGDGDGRVDVPMDIPGDAGGDGDGDGDGDSGGDACEAWPVGLGAALPCVGADGCELAFEAVCPPGTVKLDAGHLCVDFSTGACADASPCPAGHVLVCDV